MICQPVETSYQHCTVFRVHVRIGNCGGLQWMSKLELGIVRNRSKQVLYRITILSGLRFCVYFD